MNTPLITVTIILLLVAIVLIIVSLMSKKEVISPKERDHSLEEQRKEIEACIEKANASIKDLNELHAYMMLELEKKQKELMLIYDLIDEKEMRLKQVEQPQKISENNMVKTSLDKKENKKSIQNALKHIIQEEESGSTKDQVLALHSQGYSIEEIAKSLDIGKGEAKLLVQLQRKKISL